MVARGGHLRYYRCRFIEGLESVQTLGQLDMLRTAVAQLTQDGSRLALVPTMGALHEGHIALVREAARHADHVAVSIFVNPTQFGPNEDLNAYPRQMAADSAMLEAEGVALLWAPSVQVMYPQGFASSIAVEGVSAGFCGAARPGHFDGVATVVCKLFHQVLPHVALFGEKDWQQLAVIRAMARDLDLTRPHMTDIVGMPTVRESDGLAMSSRNRYLSAEQRMAAVALPNGMQNAIAQIEAGTSPARALGNLREALKAAGFDRVDYAALADADTLEPLDELETRPARLLVAARIGGTRLIDNMPVNNPAK